MKTSTSLLLRRADHTLAALAAPRRLAWPLLALLLLPALGTAATLTVSSLSDSGLGSLRETITLASPGDTIIFSVTGSIFLTNGELVVGKDLRINGPGAASLHVSGNFASRVFRVPIGVVAIISDIDIANGSAVGPDGAVGAPNRPGQAGTPGRGGGDL